MRHFRSGAKAMMLCFMLLGYDRIGRAQTSEIHVAAIVPLRKNVDALPMIRPANTPAAQRVNATLGLLNRRVLKAVRECTQQSRQGDWMRKVRLTMTGPRYLSFVVDDAMDCGGAHPDSSTMALVFDMSTGAQVNWVSLVGNQNVASAYSDSGSDGSTVGALKLPALLSLYRKSMDAECNDAIDDRQSFLLWPDVASGTLIAEPFGLPHVIQACANEKELTLAEARRLGFSEALLGAIEQAHRAELLSHAKH